MSLEPGSGAIACGECGAIFSCNPGPDCWCAALPPQPMGGEGASCLCPACLSRRASDLRAERQRETATGEL